MAKRHTSGVTGADMPPDTDNHAQTYHAGKLGDRRDELIVPGDGVYLSQNRVWEYEKGASAAGTKHHKIRIDQGIVLAWADEIRKNDEMVEARRQKFYDDKQREREEKCYEGTDTHDPVKDPKIFRERRNKFDLDKSDSTIHIGITSGTTWLNGSAVEHSHYVHIYIQGPDGRQICEVGLSYDQFAAALFSNMHQPCTLHSYWSIGPSNVLMQEVVHQPESISGRMRQRLKDVVSDLHKTIDEQMAAMQAKYENGKTLSREETRKSIDTMKRVADHLTLNTEFVVDQASEEASSVVETAAIRIANMLGTTNNQLTGIAGQPFLARLLPNLQDLNVKPVESRVVQPTKRTDQQEGPPA